MLGLYATAYVPCKGDMAELLVPATEATRGVLQIPARGGQTCRVLISGHG
jgi:hypothetical protein